MVRVLLWSRVVLGRAGDNVNVDYPSPQVDTPAPAMKWDAKLDAFAFSARTFSDEFGGAIQGDITLLSASYFILILYLVFNLGDGVCASQGCTRSRAALSFAAFVSIGLAIAASHGIAGAFGVAYGPLHSVLPFVILGIGAPRLLHHQLPPQTMQFSDDHCERPVARIKTAHSQMHELYKKR